MKEAKAYVYKEDGSKDILEISKEHHNRLKKAGVTEGKLKTSNEIHVHDLILMLSEHYGEELIIDYAHDVSKSKYSEGERED